MMKPVLEGSELHSRQAFDGARSSMMRSFPSPSIGRKNGQSVVQELCRILGIEEQDSDRMIFEVNESFSIRIDFEGDLILIYSPLGELGAVCQRSDLILALGQALSRSLADIPESVTLDRKADVLHLERHIDSAVPTYELVAAIESFINSYDYFLNVFKQYRQLG